MVKIVVVTKVVTHKQQTIQILHTTNQEKWPLCCRSNYCSNLIAEVEALVTAYREQARSISSIFLFFLIFSVINNQLSLFINDPCLIYLFIYLFSLAAGYWGEEGDAMGVFWAESRLMTHSRSCLKSWAAQRSRTVRKHVSGCPSVLCTTYACQDHTY